MTYIDQPSALKVLAHAREINPALPVIVRTRDDSGLERLEEAGAAEVVPDTFESSLMLASHAHAHGRGAGAARGQPDPCGAQPALPAAARLLPWRVRRRRRPRRGESAAPAHREPRGAARTRSGARWPSSTSVAWARR